MPDKPWEKIWITIWMAINKGWLRYITTPIFVILVFFIILPDTSTKFSKSKDFIIDFLYPTTFLSRSEFDVCNEWVAVIWSYEDIGYARAEHKKFISAYKATRQILWRNSIYLVRSTKRKNTWQIVIDMASDVSTKEEINRHLKALFEDSNSTIQRRNSFGSWLDNASVEFYDMAEFEYTYGEIENLGSSSENRLGKNCHVDNLK